MKDYKYCSNFDYPQYEIYLKVKSNKLDINNMSRENIKKLGVSLRKYIEFMVFNFRKPYSYDLDDKMFDLQGALLLYKDSYKYYSELPHRGSNKTYLSLKTLNQAMKGKFLKGTDLQTNLSRKLTKKWNKDLK